MILGDKPLISEAVLSQWHKEGIRDSEDADIMSHPTDAEAWHALDHFDPKFAGDPRSVHLSLLMDGFQPYRGPQYCVLLPANFCDAIQSTSQQISKGRVYIPCSCDSRS
jgi:hypothetical protein